MLASSRNFLRHGFLILLLFAAAALTGLYVAVATKPAPQSDIPKLDFEKFTLANGLEVILRQDRRLPVVTVNLWYHVGPANEEPGRTGFAHLFEHLMFAGSKHVPRNAHLGILEAAGATSMNATTAFDRTAYFQTVPSNQLELVLWLESDRMGYLLDALDQTAFTTQQDVVRNERRESYENQPYGLAGEALAHALYPPGHPYYAHIIGSHADIQAANLGDAKQFFKRYYAPNNASIAIVGDIDPKETRALVEKYFGSLKRGPPVARPKVEMPKLTAERRLVMRDRVELPRLYMVWLTPAMFQPGDADADIAASVLTAGLESRLYRKLVYERQIAQDVYAGQQSLMLNSQFHIIATARPGHTLEELERAIDDELESLRTKGPETREVERARNKIETDTIAALESAAGAGGVAERLNFYNHHVGTPDYLQQDIGRYRAVTPKSVSAFTRDWLRKDTRVVLHVVRGEPEPSPPVPPPAASAAATSVTESVNADEPWRSTMPKAGPLRPLRLTSPQAAQLPNGLMLILSPRHDLPAVAAHLMVRNGGDVNPPDAPGTASFTASVMTQGTRTRSALDIAEELARLAAGLNAASSRDWSAVSAYALRKNFVATLDLLADVVLNPSFPQEEIERKRAGRLARLAQMRQEPDSVAGLILTDLLYGPRHPYGTLEIGTPESVKAMTRERLVAFWEENFAPNNAALVVAGDMTMDELRALAAKAFGNWKQRPIAKRVPGEPPPIKPKIVVAELPGQPQTTLRVASIGASRSSPDYHALEVMNTALGGQFASRIHLNLREAHGYTYGASSGFSFRKYPGPFVVAANVRGDATAPALREIFGELTKMAAAPMPDDELRRAKDAMTYSLAGAFQTNSGTAANYADLYVYALPLDYYSHYSKYVNAVTAEEALAVAQRYLKPERMVVVAVGDRAKFEEELRKLGLGPVEIRTAP